MGHITNISNIKDIAELFKTEKFYERMYQHIDYHDNINDLANIILSSSHLWSSGKPTEEEVKAILTDMSQSSVLINLSLLRFLLPPGTETHVLNTLVNNSDLIDSPTKDIMLNLLAGRDAEAISVSLIKLLLRKHATTEKLTEIRAISEHIYCGSSKQKAVMAPAIIRECLDKVDSFMRIKYDYYNSDMKKKITKSMYKASVALDTVQWFIPLVIKDAMNAYYITKDLQALDPVAALLKSTGIIKMIDAMGIDIKAAVHIFAYNKYKGIPTTSVIQLAKHDLLTDTELAIAVSKRTSAQATIKLYHAILTDACENDITQLPNKSRREMLSRLTAIMMDELAETITLRGDIATKYKELLNAFDLDEVE